MRPEVLFNGVGVRPINRGVGVTHRGVLLRKVVLACLRRRRVHEASRHSTMAHASHVMYCRDLKRGPRLGCSHGIRAKRHHDVCRPNECERIWQILDEPATVAAMQSAQYHEAVDVATVAAREVAERCAAAAQRRGVGKTKITTVALPPGDSASDVGAALSKHAKVCIRYVIHVGSDGGMWHVWRGEINRQPTT